LGLNKPAKGVPAIFSIFLKTKNVGKEVASQGKKERK